LRTLVLTQDLASPGPSIVRHLAPGQQAFDSVKLAYGEQSWPDHCVQGSEGAALHKDLSVLTRSCPAQGHHRDVTAIRLFSRPTARLARARGYLGERGIKRVFVCGLATDFCVA